MPQWPSRLQCRWCCYNLPPFRTFGGKRRSTWNRLIEHCLYHHPEAEQIFDAIAREYDTTPEEEYAQLWQ